MKYLDKYRQCPVGDYLTKCLDSLSDAIRSRLWLLIDDYDAGVRAIERQSDNAEEKRAEWAAMLEVIRNTTATGDLRRVFIITTGTPNGREGLDFAKDIPQDPVFSDIIGFTERELRDLIQRAPLTSNAAVPQRKPCAGNWQRPIKSLISIQSPTNPYCRPVYACSISMRGNERNSRRSCRLNQ